MLKASSAFITIMAVMTILSTADATVWLVPEGFECIQEAISDPLVQNGDTISVWGPPPGQTEPPGGDGGGGQTGGVVDAGCVTQLYDCRPNPFSERTTIRYQIAQTGYLRLEVHDAGGRLVKRLVRGEQRAGSYSVVWDGTGDQGQVVPNGIYFYRFDVPGISESRKAVLLLR